MVSMGMQLRKGVTGLVLSLHFTNRMRGIEEADQILHVLLQGQVGSKNTCETPPMIKE